MSGKDFICYYCASPDCHPSSEHLLPAFTGSNTKVKDFVGTQCNTMFGSGFEKDVANTLHFLRVFFDVRDAEGKRPPPLRNIACEDGRNYDIFPDGAITLHKPSFHKNPTESGGAVVNASYRNWKEARKHLTNLLPVSNGQFRYRSITEYPGKFHFEIPPIGGPSFHRLAGKTILNLLASEQPEPLKICEVRELATYIRSGSGRAGEWIGIDFDNFHILPADRSFLENCAILNYVPGDLKISGYVVLLGYFPILCEIPISRPLSRGFHISIRHDPISGRNNLMRSVPIEMNGIEFCKKRWNEGFQLTYFRHAINDMLARYQKRCSNIIHAKIADDAVRSELRPTQDGFVDPKSLKRVSTKVAEDYVDFVTRKKKVTTYHFSKDDVLPDELQ